MIQVRNVRPELHAELVRRAELRGTTLTAYVEEILEREIVYPRVEDVIARVREREPVADLADFAEVFIRRMRETRGEDAWPSSSSTRRRSSDS